MGFWDSLTGAELFFLICATVGGTVFLIQMILLFTGVIGDIDGDVDHSVDVGGHDIDVDFDGEADIHISDVDAHADVHVPDGSEFSFKLLSIQGITGFLMMFGLVGLSMLRQFDTGLAISMVAAVLAGLVIVFIISWIFTLFQRMQSSGTLKLRNAVGQEGKVYLSIPEGGEVGKVEVAFQGRLTVMDAVTKDKAAVPSDTRVRVVGVTGGNILVVDKI